MDEALAQILGLQPFQPRRPWLNGDLQTLRDSLRPVLLPRDRGVPLKIPVPPLPHVECGDRPEAAPAQPLVGEGDHLLAFLDPPVDGDGQPSDPGAALGLVLLIHGLGGSSDREGLRRMGLTLQRSGFAVLRLNMRGAGPGRGLARGTYAARCNSDLLPVLLRAREIADGRPLLAVGISLGGTSLLNALLTDADALALAGSTTDRGSSLGALLDGVVCISSPLDLLACSRQIERPRNRLYERWLLRRLLEQTAADPFALSAAEQEALAGRGTTGPLRTIRAFDAAITAPRWGYPSVEAYYAAASPLPRLLGHGLPSQPPGPPLPPALIVHAADDPWVPVAATERLAISSLAAGQRGPWQVLITAKGGHNGFHAACDGPGGLDGCWGDRLAARWLRRLVGA
jgi:uncharacterized protein